MNTERIMGKTRAVAMATVALLALILACTCFTSQAFANRTIDAPTTVSDDITRVHVNKLDADTREYVQGAKMAIIEKDSGLVVDEWVTGGSTHQNEKGLDVNKVYILRELEAPDGFDKVQDVEFIVNETEGTGITIVSQGKDSELVESYKVNLYDKAKTIEDEIVVTETRGTSSSNTTSGTTKNPAPKTGDETPLWPIIALVVVGIIGIGVLEIPKRRIKE